MPETPAQTCREAAAKARTLVAHLRSDMAANDCWACDHPDACTEDEIYSDGVEDGLGGDAGAFAASWTLDVALAHAELLDAVADDFDMVERINSRDPDNDGATRVMDHPLATAALVVARAYLKGED